MSEFPMPDTDFTSTGHFLIDGVMLVNTCRACPEQYDAYKGRQKIGYFRLRHGSFRVDDERCGGQTVFRAEPDGDGIFEPHERETWLRAGVAALLKGHAQ